MKQFLLAFLSLFLVGLNVFSQGESCATAIAINGLPYNSPEYSTCGSGINYTAADRCANTYMNGEDFVFSFTPAAGQTCISATAAPTGNIFNPEGRLSLFVLIGCPDNPNGRCEAQAINTVAGNDAVVNNLQVIPGITYFFVVTDLDDCADFEFSLTASNACNTPPPGFNCNTSEAIPDLPFSLSNTTCGKRNFMNRGNSCVENINYYNSPAYFYSFTPDEDKCVQFRGNTGGPGNLRFSIHEGCPTYTNTTCLQSLVYNQLESSLFANLDSGTTYYFVISGTNCNNYNIDFLEITSQGATCNDAIEISTVNGYYENLDLSTQCKGDNIDQEYFCPSTVNHEDGNEMFFVYRSDGDECISASVVGMSDFGSISMFKSCPSVTNDSVYAFASSCINADPDQATIQYTITEPGLYYFAISGRRDLSLGSLLDQYQDFNFDFKFSSTPNKNIGLVCTTPDTIPSTLDLYAFVPGVSVQCKENDYTPADVCGFPFLAGDESVFMYTAPQDFCGTIIANGVNGTGGISLLDACPENGGNCLTASSCEFGCDSIYMDYRFEQGETYFLVVSSYDDAFSFDLLLRRQNLQTADGCPCGSQDCAVCLNSNFEFGNFSNWEGFTGNYANPKATAGLDTNHINHDLSRHTIMNAGGYDPVVGDSLLQTTGPFGDRYAVRIGNRSVGAQGDVLAYNFTVTEETKNFLYYYAVVFEDPSHTTDEQPFFSVNMVGIGPGGTEVNLSCAEYEVRPNPGDTSFKQTFDHTRPNNPNTVVRWKDWTLVAVPLDNFIGQDVRIEFVTKDCDRSGHFGYAYVDAFCGDLNLESETGFFEICPGIPLTLTAPTGFARYEWNTGETTRQITVTEEGTYTVDMIPFSVANEQACKVTLETEVTYADDPIANYEFEEGCIDEFIDFTNTSTGSPESPIAHNYWDFGDGAGIYPDTNRLHAFPGPGTYNVELVVENTVGCLDTTIQTIEIPEFPFLNPLNCPDTIRLCELDSITLQADSLGDVTYSWEGPNSFTSSERNPSFVLSDSTLEGMYYLTAVLNWDTCTTTLDSTYVKIAPIPDYFITPDTTVCFSDKTTPLIASGGEFDNSYQWSPAGIMSNANMFNPIANPNSTVLVQVQTFHSVCPDSLMELTITVDDFTSPLEVPDVIDICTFDTLKIEALADPLDFIEWYAPDSVAFTDSLLIRPNIQDSMGGYYVVSTYLGEDAYCRFGYDSVLVNVIPAPDAMITPDSAIGCTDALIQFTAQNPQPFMYWMDASGDTIGNGSPINLQVADTFYYVHYTDHIGCFNYDSVYTDEVNIVKPDLGKDRIACLGNEFVIFPFNNAEIPDHYSYQWNTGTTDTLERVSNTATLILTVGDSGCFNADTVLVNFQDPANFDMGNDTLLCEYDSLYLDFRGFGDSIYWNDGNRQFARWISYPGDTLTVDIYSGVCVLSDTMIVEFEDLNPASLPNDTSICEGSSIALTAQPPGQNYRWFDNGTLSSTEDQLTVSGTGNREIILEANTAVCTTSDTILVALVTPPPSNLPDVTICETDSALIDARVNVANASYLWSDGDTAGLRWIQTAGLHSVIINAGPCVVYDTILVTHDLLPVFSLGPDQNICEDQTANLVADNTGWNAYIWSDGTNGPSKSTSQSGAHILTATEGLCSYTDTLMLGVDTIPRIDLGPDIEICETDSALLSAGVSNPNITFNWSTGESSASIWVSSPGNYGVTLQNGQCTFTDDLNVTVQSLPGVELGPDQVLCLGDSTEIGFNTSNASYQWNTGETTPRITVTETNTYILTVTQNLCVESDSVEVRFDELIKPDLGPDIIQCDSIVANLDAATIAQEYLWSLNGSLLNFQTRTLGINLPGTYVVTAIQGTCSDADTLNVSIQNSHTIALSKDSVLCEGEQYVLNSFTNASNPFYHWSNGAQTPSTTVYSTNNYVLEIASGVCTVSDTAKIVFVPHPFIDLEPGALICEDQIITIGDFFPTHPDDTNKVRYAWNTGDTTDFINVSEAGQYVERVQIEHCFNSDYFDLRVKEKPVPDMSDPYETCGNRLYPISTGLPQLQTTWSNGAGFGHTITPGATGTYVATIFDGPCVVQDSVSVIINPVPEFEIADLWVCPTDSMLVFGPTEDSLDVFWNGLNQDSIFVRKNDTVYLEVVNEFGCRNFQTLYVREDKSCEGYIYIPNAFSPDGDNINELFSMVISEAVAFDFLKVFDRWGNEIFNTSDKTRFWDGTYRGSKVKPGVYVWRIHYFDQYNDGHYKTGHVTVIR